MNSIKKQGYFNSPDIKSDIISGFLVFLIALPLCLGIAKASHFPLLAGIITASIGGVLVGLLAGSPLTIKGPAAGLISIAAGCVIELGQGDMMAGYKLTLAVIVVASVIQVFFGLVKAGRFGDFFPNSAVHGMLAAIGLIIIGKQIHKLFGVTAMGKEPLELLVEIPYTIGAMNPHIAIIGVVCLAILALWPMIPSKNIKSIPGSLVALLAGVALGHYFNLFDKSVYDVMGKTFETGPNFLVTIDKPLLESFVFPDFSQVFSGTSLKYIMMFALVGTLESMLTVKAIDNLNPRDEQSDINRDILTLGLGNILSGLIGGLPMIAEVGRSSSNLANGARSRWGNIFHGLFIFCFVAFFAVLLHQIPEASLAAMLVFTGYRLASPKHFKNIAQIGWEQLIIFVSTIIVTLATDLLVGIGFGILVKFIIQIIFGSRPRNFFFFHATVDVSGSVNKVTVTDVATFTNYLSFKTIMHKLPKGKDLIINFSQSKFVDHTFMEHLQHWSKNYKSKGQSITLIGLERHIPQSNHLLAARILASSTDSRTFENPVLI